MVRRCSLGVGRPTQRAEARQEEVHAMQAAPDGVLRDREDARAVVVAREQVLLLVEAGERRPAAGGRSWCPVESCGAGGRRRRSLSRAGWLAWRGRRGGRSRRADRTRSGSRCCAGRPLPGSGRRARAPGSTGAALPGSAPARPWPPSSTRPGRTRPTPDGPETAKSPLPAENPQAGGLIDVAYAGASPYHARVSRARCRAGLLRSRRRPIWRPAPRRPRGDASGRRGAGGPTQCRGSNAGRDAR